MAIGSLKKMNASAAYGTVASAQGDWMTVNDNASTAQTAGDELNISAIDDATFHWVKVGSHVTRVLIGARIDDAVTTITTSPTFFLVGVWGDWNESTNSWNSIDRVMRLDAAAWATTPTTLTLLAAASLSKDGTYAHTNPTTLDGYDLKGAPYFGVIIDTAASISGGANTVVEVQALGIN